MSPRAAQCPPDFTTRTMADLNRIAEEHWRRQIQQETEEEEQVGPPGLVGKSPPDTDMGLHVRGVVALFPYGLPAGNPGVKTSAVIEIEGG